MIFVKIVIRKAIMRKKRKRKISLNSDVTLARNLLDCSFSFYFLEKFLLLEKY